MQEIEAAQYCAGQRFNMLLLIVFGSAGLLMAMIGVYGVMSYSVQQRTQELGVRMALGAQTSNLRNMVIGQGMMLSGLGVVLGIGGAFAADTFSGELFIWSEDVGPGGVLVAPMILCAVALIAVWIPARRATRVDPMTALRIE